MTMGMTSMILDMTMGMTVSMIIGMTISQWSLITMMMPMRMTMMEMITIQMLMPVFHHWLWCIGIFIKTIFGVTLSIIKHYSGQWVFHKLLCQGFAKYEILLVQVQTTMSGWNKNVPYYTERRVWWTFQWPIGSWRKLSIIFRSPTSWFSSFSLWCSSSNHHHGSNHLGNHHINLYHHIHLHPVHHHHVHLHHVNDQSASADRVAVLTVASARSIDSGVFRFS